MLGCGFSISASGVTGGDSPDGGQSGSRDASAADPPKAPEDGAASLGSSGDEDAGGESDAAAAIGDAGCGPTTFAENFAGTLAGWSTYGPVAIRPDGPQGNFARLIDNQDGVSAGMFWLPQAKAKEIHVTFRYRVDVPSGTTYIGDGLTFTWLTNNGPTAIGTNSISGQALGLWPGPSGHAFILDSWQNSGIGDEDAPYFSFIKIDSARGRPGDYAWHVRRSPAYDYSVYNRWWPVDITIAAGKANAMIGSTRVIRDATLDTTTNITGIGFTAATGGAYPMRISIDTVQFELLNATCN